MGLNSLILIRLSFQALQYVLSQIRHDKRSYVSLFSSAVVSELVSRWLALFTPVLICKFPLFFYTYSLISSGYSVLLDDCLAAVDSHVARHIFSESLPAFMNQLTSSAAANVIGPQGILASKARILVTNSIAFVREFDELAFIRRGIILEIGSYDSLMSKPEGELSRLVYVEVPSSLLLLKIFGQTRPWQELKLVRYLDAIHYRRQWCYYTQNYRGRP